MADSLIKLYPEKRANQDIKGHIIKVIQFLLLLLFENHSVRQYKSDIAMLEAEPNMARFSLMYTPRLYCVLGAIASSNACMALWHRQKSLTVDSLMLERVSS